MKSTMLAGFAAVIGIAALLWASYLHFGRTTLSLEEMTVEKLSARSIVVESEGRELVLLTKSTVTGGGAIALLNAKGDQVFVASDGTLALRGGDSEVHRTLVQNLRGWSLVLTATPDSSTVAMKGTDGYEVVIEAGKTLDDPLAIRGGRINIRSGSTSAKLDASGLKAAPPREW